MSSALRREINEQVTPFLRPRPPRGEGECYPVRLLGEREGLRPWRSFENAGTRAPALLPVRAVLPSGGWTETPHQTASTGLGLWSSSGKEGMFVEPRWRLAQNCAGPSHTPRAAGAAGLHAGTHSIDVNTLFFFLKQGKTLMGICYVRRLSVYGMGRLTNVSAGHCA